MPIEYEGIKASYFPTALLVFFLYGQVLFMKLHIEHGRIYKFNRTSMCFSTLLIYQ